ncbi:MAG TPA: hypothetical protein ENK57_00225 [Polyangiaceae bacterium]|nr:hypothetical protein [Polyangiaceae bacterium]
MGCDTPERVDGLERVTATLQEGVVSSTKEAESIRQDIEVIETRSGRAETDRRALEERIETLETALARIDAQLEA